MYIRHACTTQSYVLYVFPLLLHNLVAKMCPRDDYGPTSMAGARLAQQVPIAGLAANDTMVRKAKDKEPFNTTRQRVRQPTEVQLSHYSADGQTLHNYISNNFHYFPALLTHEGTKCSAAKCSFIAMNLCLLPYVTMHTL